MSMIKQIVFGTTNAGKLREATEILGLNITGTPLNISEVQSLDPIEVATRKVKDYFKALNKPILVEDVSLVFLALGKLPGPYITDFEKSIGNEGLVKLIGNKNRRAIAQTTLAFANADGEVHIFEGKVDGTIAESPRGNNGFGWDPIFIPNGKHKTFAEMEPEEKNQYSMRAMALKKFHAWLKQNASMI